MFEGTFVGIVFHQNIKGIDDHKLYTISFQDSLNFGLKDKRRDLSYVIDFIPPIFLPNRNVKQNQNNECH